MYKKTRATLVLVATGLLLGCDRHPVENASQSTPPYVSQAAPTAQVAVPPGDASVPPADAALLRPNTGTDATGNSTLTRSERDTQMPMPGQANDHSTPEFAKKGDAAATAKSVQ